MMRRDRLLMALQIEYGRGRFGSEVPDANKFITRARDGLVRITRDARGDSRGGNFADGFLGLEVPIDDSFIPSCADGCCGGAKVHTGDLL